MPSRRHDELPTATTRQLPPTAGSQEAAFVRLPTPALRLLAEVGVAGSDGWEEQGKLGLPRPVRRFVRAGVVLEVASDNAGALRIRRETWGRRWAAEQGIDTAFLHGAAVDGTWMIGQWLTPLASYGPPIDWEDWDRYLDAALAAATAIAAADPPPAGPTAAIWRSDRRSRLVRAARGVLAGVPQRLWWAARTAAAGLPTVAVSHGDFYHRNVAWDSSDGRACTVDWEYLGRGPRYGDLVRFWSVLPDRAHRDAWLGRVWSAVPDEHHRDVALLALWFALRRIGENVKAPRAHRNAHDTAHAWSVLPEAQELARCHGVHPR